MVYMDGELEFYEWDGENTYSYKNIGNDYRKINYNIFIEWYMNMVNEVQKQLNIHILEI
jgi:hypothetical protein